MKKIITFLVVLSMCVILFGNNISPIVKTEALTIPHKISYADFTSKEQKHINELASISNNSPTSKASYINKIYDEELYEYCLKETLDVYYSDLEKYESELKSFKNSISSNADAIINNYEIAAEERATAEKNGYSPTEVLVSFEPGTSENTIKTIAENLGSGYEVIFDGFFEPADDIPEIRKEHIDKNKDYGAIVSVDVDLDKTTNQTIQEMSIINCVSTTYRNNLYEDNAYAINYSNEPRVSEQYYLDRINIADAWQAIKDSRVFTETWVAVLDSGLDVDHEDVVGNFQSRYSVDITKTGYPKLTEVSVPYSSSHGTAVWGVIRARPLNNTGITGMHLPLTVGYSGMIKVMAVKVRNDNGTTTTANLVNSINFAVETGA